jgi:hypothetical protein
MAFSKQSQTIAFFGATGGCTNAALVYSLKSGIKVSALARTPSKLEAALLKQGISKETLRSNLRIVQGDARDSTTVKTTLLIDETTGQLVDGIVSGIGGTPKLEKGLIPQFTLDNPHITEETTNALIKALEELRQQYPHAVKPWFTVISTTGLSTLSTDKADDAKDKEVEDVPFLFRGMYHWMLHVPHEDKLVMEELVMSHRGLFAATVILRPSLLTGDGTVPVDFKPKKVKKIRTGTANKPAVGYTIDRAAVGKWIFDEVVQKGRIEEHWNGKKITLTS